MGNFYTKTRRGGNEELNKSATDQVKLFNRKFDYWGQKEESVAGCRPKITDKRWHNLLHQL